MEKQGKARENKQKQWKSLEKQTNWIQKKTFKK